MAKARFEITRFPTVLCTKIMTVTPVLGDESLEMFTLPLHSWQKEWIIHIQIGNHERFG